MNSALSGVSSAGLCTTTLPAARAAAILVLRQDEREVERRDGGDDAHRLAQRVGQRGDGRRPGGAREALGQGGAVLVLLGGGLDVDGPAQGDRLADVVALDGDQLVGPLADQVGGAAQDPGPVAGGRPRPRPALEGLAGVAHGMVDVRGVGLHHRGEDVAVGGVDHVAPRAGRALMPASADEQLSGRESLCLLRSSLSSLLSGNLLIVESAVAVVTLSMPRWKFRLPGLSGAI